MTNEGPSKAQLWAGRGLSTLTVLAVLVAGVTKLSHKQTVIGTIEIFSAVISAVPQTSVLGALILTAYIGGATAMHVLAGEPFIPAIILGIVVWLGLVLREPRLRALVPLRR